MQTKAEGLFAEQEQPPYLIFVCQPEFDIKKSGLVGLVASRLTEAYHRPAIVACRDNGFVRASCRSISQFHITQALDQCAHLLVRYGGHAMAAGFTVSEENLDELMGSLQQIAEQELMEKDLRPVLEADLIINLASMRGSEIEALMKELDCLEPTGMENRSAALISRGLQVTGKRTMGKEGQHLRLTVKDKDNPAAYTAVAFRMGHMAENLPPKVDLLYAFERNTYMGQTTLQLMVRDIKPAETSRL